MKDLLGRTFLVISGPLRGFGVFENETFSIQFLLRVDFSLRRVGPNAGPGRLREPGFGWRFSGPIRHTGWQRLLGSGHVLRVVSSISDPALD